MRSRPPRRRRTGEEADRRTGLATEQPRIIGSVGIRVAFQRPLSHHSGKSAMYPHFHTCPPC